MTNYCTTKNSGKNKIYSAHRQHSEMRLANTVDFLAHSVYNLYAKDDII